MVVRPARETDLDAIAAITNHYIVNTAIHFAYEPVTVDDLRAQWQHYSARFPWLVVEEGPPGSAGPIAGFAKAGLWRERSAYAWTTELGLYIDPNARGRGLGTALYEEMMAQLRIRDFRSAVAGITLPNDASISLHRKFGFEPVGTFYDAGYKMGSWHSVQWWQKRFAIGPERPLTLQARG